MRAIQCAVISVFRIRLMIRYGLGENRVVRAKLPAKKDQTTTLFLLR